MTHMHVVNGSSRHLGGLTVWKVDWCGGSSDHEARVRCIVSGTNLPTLQPYQLQYGIVV
jgi:hypothetical protein